MKSLFSRLLAAGAAVLLSTAANAGVMTIDVTDVASWDGIGDPDNVVLTIDLGAGAVITGIGWDVSITPVGESWYSEATAGFTDSSGMQGVDVSPGAGNDNAGFGITLPFSSDGIVDLTDNGIDDMVLADGILLIEFFEAFDDVSDAIDSVWGGSLTISTASAVVPLPAAAWLLLSGLLGLFGLRRRA